MLSIVLILGWALFATTGLIYNEIQLHRVIKQRQAFKRAAEIAHQWALDNQKSAYAWWDYAQFIERQLRDHHCEGEEWKHQD